MYPICGREPRLSSRLHYGLESVLRAVPLDSYDVDQYTDPLVALNCIEESWRVRNARIQSCDFTLEMSLNFMQQAKSC